MAKARGAVSAAVLRDGLKVSPVAAEALLGQMRVRGVIGPVGRDGMARAAEPMFRAGVAPGQRRPGVWPRLAVQIRRATARYQGAGRAALN
ncbi:hypothetical protein ACS3SW_14805 [Roseobacteraceae bacterium S113]